VIGDPRAAYAILDTETMRWENHRVSYNVPIVQERMRLIGLPQVIFNAWQMDGK